MIKHYLNIANGQRYFKKQNIHYTYKKSIICRKYVYINHFKFIILLYIMKNNFTTQLLFDILQMVITMFHVIIY